VAPQFLTLQMRIWSLHPKYLDTKGLVALWRETLLAKHVLEGLTKGYKNHPQLDRFKNCPQPVDAIHRYLSFVYDEALARGYNFSADKFDSKRKAVRIPVTEGQLDYETAHLLRKLKTRDPALHRKLKAAGKLIPHPVFRLVKGGVEDWEIVE
jgi:hypothetical protein